MDVYNEGDEIEFTWCGNFIPDLGLSPVWEKGSANLGYIGRGVIMGPADRSGHYPIKVVYPDHWRGGNDLGGKLHGDDRGKGTFLRPEAMRLKTKKSVSAPLPSDTPQSSEKTEKERMMEFLKGKSDGDGRRCPNCHAVMIPLLGTEYFCPNGCDKKVH